jgi:hypothetical protein
MKYQNTQADHEINPAFWNEVLLGRTIQEALFDNDGIKALKLDNGEEVVLVGLGGRGTLGVSVDD